MAKAKKGVIMGLMIGFISLMATSAFARSVSLKEGGVALWIFIIVGAAIILMQAIPAGILLFSLVGTSSTLAFGRKRREGVKEEETEPSVSPGYETARAEK